MSKIAQKSPIFPPPVYLTPPMKGLPLEFGIGVRGRECFYDGAIRWSKKFSDTFSRFDTIPAVTDSQPPSQPASHVAVAITLNAKASSLIKPEIPKSKGTRRTDCTIVGLHRIPVLTIQPNTEYLPQYSAGAG